MLRWLTKSRLRAALAILFFGAAFLCSIPLIMSADYECVGV
jgi:hypothetical protein